MLIDSIRRLIYGGTVDFPSVVAQILSVLCIIIFILPFHELAHGFVAYKLGDPTAKLSGRLTFNPLASVDPMGALWMLLFNFGWAKPVPVDPRNLKKPKRDMAIIALAGPIANLVAGLVGAIIYCAMVAFRVPENNVTDFIFSFLSFYVIVNVALAVFNLLPIPPLDGSKILGSFLSDSIMEKFYRYQSVISMVFFVLLLSGVFSGPLSRLQILFSNGVFYIAQLPFKLFGLL